MSRLLHRPISCVSACLGWLLVCLHSTAAHAETTVDKSGYSFAHPTPDSELREFMTDRPDVTESPFTVDAGHVQLEMDLVNHTSNHLDGVHTKEWGAAPFNLRFGLLSDLEAGIFVAPYIHHTERPAGGRAETHSGFGDVTLRVKKNFWGDDRGATAFGVIVDVKLPTAERDLGNNAVEGTVLLPANFKLGHGWEVGAMTGVNFRKSDLSGSRRGVWINSVTAGHEITEAIGAYFELTSEAGDGAHVATFDTGVTFSVDANTQFDVGVQLGLSRTADDAVMFVGLARRY